MYSEDCGKVATMGSRFKLRVIIFAVIIIVGVIGGTTYTLMNRGGSGSGTATTTVSTRSSPSTWHAALVRGFLAGASEFYLEHEEASRYSVGNFCRALLLNSTVVNATTILIAHRPYRYGVLAFMLNYAGYWFAKQLKLKDITVTHIPPPRNLTLTGGFGRVQWFRISRDGIVKTEWFTERAGIVYKDRVICSTTKVSLGNEELLIVHMFVVRTENGVEESSLWLALLPTG